MSSIPYLMSAAWPALLLLGGAGWGCLLLRTCPCGPLVRHDLYASAFAGILLISLGAILVNFWTSLGSDPGLWTVAAGLVPFFVQACRHRRWRAQSTLLIIVVALYAWLRRNMTLGHDAGLYHLPQMNWIAIEPAVSGLANLDGRLGFNSTWILYLSALRVDSLFGWRHVLHVEIAIRALAAAWIAWRFMRELALGWSPLARLYTASLATFIVCNALLPHVSSVDTPVNLCALLAWVAYAELCLEPRSSRASARFACLLILSLLAVAIKLSQLPLLLLPAHGLWLLLKRGRASAAPVVGWALGVSSLVLGAWVARGYVTSGCLFYPAATTCLGPPWAVPVEQAAGMSATITDWARTPGGGFRPPFQFWDLSWIPDWLGRFLQCGPAVLLASAAVVWLLAKARALRRAQPALPAEPDEAGTRVVVIAGLALWLTLAPDPRFSWSFFAIASAALVRAALATVTLAGGRSVALRRAFRVPGSVHAFLLAAAAACALLAALSWPALLPTSPDADQVQTHNHVTILRPRAGLCWTLIPCSPYPVDTIDARHDAGHWSFAPAHPAR